MRTIREITDEKVYSLFRRFLDSGIPLQKEEAKYLAIEAGRYIEAALAECMTAIPRKAAGAYRLTCHSDRSVSGKHIIDGQWRLITQVFKDDKIYYYTDGKEEVNGSE